MKKHLLAASLVLTSLSSSLGAGYQLNLQGLRQLAMGGSGTAIPWDVSTIFYNPGGLARLKNIQAYASGMVIAPSAAFGNNVASAQSKARTFTPFNLYVGGTLREGGKLALGLGVYTPYGTGLSWDNNWIGRYMVQSISLKAVFFQPTISYRLGNFLSVGAGLIYANGVFDFQQALPVQDINGNDATAKLHGVGGGVGFNLGMSMRFSERLQMGLTYRSQVNMDLSGGSAKFDVPYTLKSYFPNTRFESSLPLPQVASFGLGIKPLSNNRLTLQFDLNYTGWSSYSEQYFNFAVHTPSLTDIHAPRKYKDTWTERIGGHFKISKIVSIMAGAAYDQSPVTDGNLSPDLPDADRVLVTCGATIHPLPRFTIMTACEFMTSLKRSSTYDFGGFSGTYVTKAITPGLGFYYNF